MPARLEEAQNDDGCWAERDIISGGDTVISAMGEGEIAAADMNEWLTRDGKWS